MLSKNFKFILNFILLLGFLHGAHCKQCYSCEGINCLRTSKVKETATCIDPVDDCITVFEGVTVIARGCYSKLPQEHRSKCDNLSNSECHKCYKDLCNDRGPIECVQCNSNDNEKCSTSSSQIASTRCPVSTSPNSYCYSRSTSGHIERGCLLSTDEQIKCLNDNSCEMCLPGSGEACNREVNDIVENSGAKQVTIFSMLIIMAVSINTLFLK